MGLKKQADFHGKKVHVIGAARSGLAAAEVLVSLGSVVTMHDEKDSAELEDALRQARKIGVRVMTGARAYEGIESADLVIPSPGVPGTCPALVTACDCGIPIMSEVELGYRVSQAPIIAVTGTNGKTTTSALVGEILRRDGGRVYVAGNIAAGDIKLPLSKAALQASPSDVIVAEISSFQLEWISSFRPRIAALLNVSADHLDRHSDLTAYARTKGRIFECQEEEDYAVLNADDPLVMELASGIRSQVWQFSRKGEVELGTFVRGTEVWFAGPTGTELACDTAAMKLRGAHNLENVLAAAAVALAFGAKGECVQQSIDAFEPLEHRLEPVAEIGGVEFLNNSMCTNVLAGVRSLEAIGRPAVVIAGGKGKGSDYRPLGEAFVRGAKHVVLMGEDARLIDEAARAAGFDRISHVVSMEEAVEVAWRHAQPGDAVVLSPGCKSFDMFRDFEHRGQVFKTAVAALAARTGGQS